MHFRVISARKPQPPEQKLPGSSLPPEFQWEYRQWLLEADRTEKDVVVAVPQCTAMALKKDVALIRCDADDDNMLEPAQAKKVRKPKKDRCEVSKPQRATYISGSLKPSVSRLVDREHKEETRCASEPRNTRKAQQQRENVVLTLPAITSSTDNTQPLYHPSHCSTSPPRLRNDSGDMSPSLTQHRRMPARHLNADDPRSSGQNSMGTTTCTDLPSLIDPNSTRRKFLEILPAVKVVKKARLSRIRRDYLRGNNAETMELVEAYHQLAQTQPRRPKWENEDLYEDSGDTKEVNIRTARKQRPRQKRIKIDDTCSPDKCSKRVTKLLGSLRDIRLEMHAVVVTFEAVLAQGGVLAKSIFSAGDTGSDGGSSLIAQSAANLKKMKTKIRQIRQLQRTSVANRWSVAIGLGLNAHDANVMIGSPDATLASGEADEDGRSPYFLRDQSCKK
eukprot:GEMP01034654.1.p1 GENE.GEMP01034654.1~~GEMP01034654.1.p1  ORF type:complete len:447 (+),score=99.73 GEMP01034654.1:230-1570(+)